jgi:hypothetical protein
MAGMPIATQSAAGRTGTRRITNRAKARSATVKALSTIKSGSGPAAARIAHKIKRMQSANGALLLFNP